MKKYQFEAVIKAGGRGGAYVEFPYSVEEEFGIKGRVKIICTFDGHTYQGSMVKMGTPCHIIIVLKSIRAALNKDIGDQVKVELSRDTSERIVDIHPWLKDALSGNSEIFTVYKKLSYTRLKEMNKALFDAKKDETRSRRLDKILEELQSKI